MNQPLSSAQFRVQSYRHPESKWGPAAEKDHAFEVASRDGDHFGVVGVSAPRTHYREGPVREADGQLGLFGVEHKPAYVGVAFYSPGGQHMFPTALGAAVNESRARGWGTPVADEGLSPHSAKVVQHLVDKGVIANPQGGDKVQAVNDNDWKAGHASAVSAWFERSPGQRDRDLHPTEVASGRQTVREALRGHGRSTAPLSGNQFQQPLWEGK